MQCQSFSAQYSVLNERLYGCRNRTAYKVSSFHQFYSSVGRQVIGRQPSIFVPRANELGLLPQECSQTAQKRWVPVSSQQCTANNTEETKSQMVLTFLRLGTR